MVTSLQECPLARGSGCVSAFTLPPPCGAFAGRPLPLIPVSLLPRPGTEVPAQSSLCWHVLEALVPGVGTARPPLPLTLQLQEGQGSGRR